MYTSATAWWCIVSFVWICNHQFIYSDTRNSHRKKRSQTYWAVFQICIAWVYTDTHTSKFVALVIVIDNIFVMWTLTHTHTKWLDLVPYMKTKIKSTLQQLNTSNGIWHIHQTLVEQFSILNENESKNHFRQF